MKYIKKIIIDYNKYDSLKEDIDKIEIKEFDILPMVKNNNIYDFYQFTKNLDLLLKIKQLNVPKIFVNAYSSYDFFRNHQRFIQFEDEVANNSASAFYYAKEILLKPWNNPTINPKIDSKIIKRAHDNIFSNSYNTFNYVKEFNEVYMNGDLETSKKIEQIISQDESIAYDFFKKFYSKKNPNKPWIEAEDTFYKISNQGDDFIKYINQVYQNEIPSERLLNTIFKINDLNIIFKIYIKYENFIILNSELNERFLKSIKSDKQIFTKYTLRKIKKDFDEKKYYIPAEKEIFENNNLLIGFLELLIPVYNEKMYNQEKEQFDEFIKKTEDHISLNGEMSYKYSTIINQRFIKGENSIIQSPTNLYHSVGSDLQDSTEIEYSVAILYFMNFFDSRWLELEEHILKLNDPFYVINYTNRLYRFYDFKDFRWSEGEEIILKTPPQKPISTSINDADNALIEISSPQVIFAKYVLEDRWPEYEKIVKDINGIVEYAINVLNEPWEEKEKFFNTDIYPLQFPLEYGRLNPIEEYKRFFKHELQERQA
jgi:hypothetical protein